MIFDAGVSKCFVGQCQESELGTMTLVEVCVNVSVKGMVVVVMVTLVPRYRASALDADAQTHFSFRPKCVHSAWLFNVIHILSKAYHIAA